MRRIAALLTTALLPIVFAGPSSAADPLTVVRIGAVVDQTGGSTSPLYRAAIELAGKQMNDALTRAKSPLRFELVFGDSKSNPPFAQQEALRLINQEAVKALVSDSSGVTVAINRLNYDANSPAKSKVAITCFQCSSSFINDPKVTESDPAVQAAERDADNWLYRVFYAAKYEAATLVQIALAKTKGVGDRELKIAVFADGGHRALATAIEPTLPSFRKAPTQIAITYFTSLDNLAADWTKVMAANPDVAIVAMLPEAASAAIQAYRKGGYKTPLLSNNSFRRNYIVAQMGSTADGIEGSSVTLVDKSASGTDFLKAFQAATGKAPEMTSSGAYDSAVTLMLAALVAAGDAKNPAIVTAGGIRAGLGKLADPKGAKIRPAVDSFAAAARTIGSGKPIHYYGAYHTLDWDSVGDMFPPLVRWTVEKGQFVERELYRCDAAHPLCPVEGRTH